MRRVITTLLLSLATVAAALAQTPREIISRMEEKLDSFDTENVYMICDVKVPVLGTMTTYVYSYGEKSRVEATIMGVQIITWDDGTTSWTYNSKTDEVEIEDSAAGEKNDSEGDMSMLDNIADGYDLTIAKETPEAWHISCKKSKSNKSKDDPRSMELVVAKGSFLPVSLSAKMSGVSMTMHDMRFNVTEAQCTFNPADYPTAKIIDNRGQKQKK